VTKTPGKLATWGAVSEFIFGGNATFTLVSLKTGARFTYKVRAKKADVERCERELALQRLMRDNGVLLTFEPPSVDVTYFVNLLRGPNNERDFAYMGVLRKPARFFRTAASGKVGRGAPACKALLWFLDAMARGRGVLGKTLEVWHEGRCACCGRKLTVPESIASGFGEHCARLRGATYRPAAAVKDAAPALKPAAYAAPALFGGATPCNR
jgi:hypothetical protein